MTPTTREQPYGWQEALGRAGLFAAGTWVAIGLIWLALWMLGAQGGYVYDPASF